LHGTVCAQLERLDNDDGASNMSDTLTVANTIQQHFPQAVMEIIEFRGDVTLVVDRASLVEVATFWVAF
jgi:hypothetical protein